MGTVAHAHCGAPGVEGHLQIVRGVAHHQGAFGRYAQFGHQLVEHARMGLARRLVRRSRGVKKIFERDVAQGLVQAPAAFACGYRQKMLALLERGQHVHDARKQGDVVLVQRVVVLVALTQQGVLFSGHIGRGMGQSLRQAQANDVRRVPVAGHRATDVGHGQLDAAGNDGRGIKQRAVPVKGNQVKAPGALGGFMQGHGQVGRRAGRRKLGLEWVCPQVQKAQGLKLWPAAARRVETAPIRRAVRREAPTVVP